MNLVKSSDGRWWYTCEDSQCPALEHPEDLHSHELILSSLTKEERAELLAAALAELQRRKDEKR
jgi:hypothetical protein